LDGVANLTLRKPGQPDQKIEFASAPGDVKEPSFHAWATLMRDAIRDGRQIEPSFQDGVACAQVMDQLRANAIWIQES
jgi:hypothetical protein